MVFVKLSSTNPKLGFIIFKNPSSGMQLRSIRKGTAHGYYTFSNGKIDPQEYNVYFRDSDSEVSYKKSRDEQFEYINVLRYNSSLCVVNCISEFFKSTISKQHQDDISSNEIFNNFTVLTTKFKLEKSISQALMNCGFTVNIQHEVSNSYKIQVSTNRPIRELLMFSEVFFMLNAISNNELVDINKDIVNKLVNQVVELDLPYYVRYFLSSNVISPSIFKTVKNKLEESKNNTMSLQSGNTHNQRKSFLDVVVPMDSSIVDIGCGAGFYAIPYSQKIKSKDKHYIAIDNDENELRKLENKIKSKNIDNIIVYNSVDSFFNSYRCFPPPLNVLITEMLEHLDIEEASKLLCSVFSIDFDTIVITVPNGSFNKHYPMSGFRHPDHKWEPTKDEFLDFISLIYTSNKQVSYMYYQVGDRVDGESVSHGMVIKYLFNEI